MNVKMEGNHSEGPWQAEEMAQRNFMKFSKREHRVLHQGRKQSQTGAGCAALVGHIRSAGSSPAFPSGRETLSILEQIQQRATMLLRDWRNDTGGEAETSGIV